MTESRIEGLEGQIQQRKIKTERLRSQGIDPYPGKFNRTHDIAQAITLFIKREKLGGYKSDPKRQIAGRLVAQRLMGKLAFLDIQDGSGRIQLSIRQENIGDKQFALLKELDLGDFIGVKGHLFRTRTEEITLQIGHLTVLSKALRPLPEKWHGLQNVEQRYRQRYLDLASNLEVRNIFQARSRIISYLRHFLDNRGFLEMETPMLLSIPAGAMAQPFSTHHNTLDENLFLRIATELHLKRLIVGGFDKVYEIGRIFRNEGIDTKHNPEFTTLESYEAYADYQDVMFMVEQMVSGLALELLGSYRVKFKDTEIDFTPPWRRLDLRQSVKDATGIDILSHECSTVDGLRRKMEEQNMTPQAGVSWSQLADKLISDRIEPQLQQPTFLIDYPTEMSPLAKQKINEPNLVERFEAFAGGMEIANAFTELNDPIEQRERMVGQEEARKMYATEDFDRLDEDFLVAIEHGMPPTGGLGMGIDRLTMLITGQESIRESILFPTLRNRDS